MGSLGIIVGAARMGCLVVYELDGSCTDPAPRRYPIPAACVASLSRSQQGGDGTGDCPCRPGDPQAAVWPGHLFSIPLQPPTHMSPAGASLQVGRDFSVSPPPRFAGCGGSWAERRSLGERRWERLRVAWKLVLMSAKQKKCICWGCNGFGLKIYTEIVIVIKLMKSAVQNSTAGNHRKMPSGQSAPSPASKACLETATWFH